MFDQGALGIAQVETSSGRFIKINRKFCDIVGYSCEEMMHKDIHSITHPEDLGVEKSRIKQLIAGKIEWFKTEKRYYHANDRMAWVEQTIIPLWATGAIRDFYLVIIQEITERKLIGTTDSFLLQSVHTLTGERFFESLVRYLAETLDMDFVSISRFTDDLMAVQTEAVYNNGRIAPDVSFTLDDTSGGITVERVIENFKGILQRLMPADAEPPKITTENFIGTLLWSSAGTPIGIIVMASWIRHVNTPLAKKILEMVAVRAAGEMERLLKLQMLRNEQNILEIRVMERTKELEMVNLVLESEIGARQTAESLLRKSEERYRRITESLTDYQYHVEVCDGHIVRTVHNTACEKVTGYTVEELELDPRLWMSIVPEDDRELVERNIQKLISNGTIQEFEHRILRKDGVQRWVSAVLLPDFDYNGNLISFDGVIIDISKRKESENLIKTANSRLLLINALLKNSWQQTDLRTFLTRSLELFFTSSAHALKALGYIFIRDKNDNFTTWARYGFNENDSCTSSCPYFDDCYCGNAVKRKKMIYQAYADNYHSQTAQEHGHYIVPIIYKGQIKGVLCLYIEPGHGYDKNEADFLESIANTLANIIDRKENEDLLKENEERFRTIADYTYDWELWRLPDESFAYVSPSAERITGYSANEIQADPELFERIIYPDDRKALATFFNKKRFPDVSEMRFRIVHRNGNVRWIDSIRYDMYSRSNNYLGYRASNRDITDLVAVEQQKNESQEMFSQLADNIHQIFFLIDVSANTFLYVSPAVEKIVGISPDGLEKSSITIFKKFIDADDLRRLESIDKLFEKSTKIDTEFKIVRKGGKKRWLHVRTFPIIDTQEKIKRIAGIATDITEQKIAAEKEKRHLQQLQQADKMASLGVLVSGVAHEINNPNNFIMLNTPLLRQSWEDARAIIDDYAARFGDFKIGGIMYSRMSQKIPYLFDGIEKGSRRIQRIVADLKNYARQDQGVCDRPIEINEVVREATSLMHNMIAKHTEHFSFIPSAEPIYLQGNGQKLEQVFLNLIQNSCEALQSREDALEIHVSLKDETCVISIRDEGEGISPSDLMKITDPFFTTKQSKGGTGLGLSVSAGIIKDHGGSLVFESEIKKGTVARVVLPLEKRMEKNEA